MKRCRRLWEKWWSLIIAYLGLTNGTNLQTTYHFRHMGGGHMQKPWYSQTQNANSKSSTGNNMKLIFPNNNEKRVYQDKDFPRDFIREIADIKIPYREYPRQLTIKEKIDEEEEDGYVREDDDYSGYNSEEHGKQKRPNYHFTHMTNRYKVKEKIPDDTKYVPPKMKIVAIPAPCVRTPPLPRPHTPRPPSIKSYPPSTYFKDNIKFPYYKGTKKFPKMIASYPYIIRKIYTPVSTKKIIIRDPRMPSNLVKEVHIHHHHRPPTIPVEMHLHKSQGDSMEITPIQKKRLEMVIKQLKNSKYSESSDSHN